MQNPFQDDDYNSRDTDKFISTYTFQQKKSYYHYITIGLIYILECFTSTYGALSEDKSNGLFNSKLTYQYWLLTSGIYSIIGLIMIYQFNQKTYENKLYFIVYDFIKCCWLIIGAGLFAFNQIVGCNFLIGYSLFYLLLSVLITSSMVMKTIKLTK